MDGVDAEHREKLLPAFRDKLSTAVRSDIIWGAGVGEQPWEESFSTGLCSRVNH